MDYTIRPISISLSPNTERDDISLAFALLWKPWKWIKGETIELLETKFAEYLGVQKAVSFNSGRSAFVAILRALKLQKGDEVLIQAFTCNAVPNPILWEGLKPVYVDCRADDFNMDAVDLEKKITSKSKVVVVQHTFGLPADITKIQEVCKRHNLILIEDCAHALGAKYQGKQVGNFGKAAFFSFSRDKVISSVYGGMVATNDAELASVIRDTQEEMLYPSLFWVKQQLLHPVLMNLIILPTYGVLGRYLLILLQRIHFLSKAVHWKEKRGKRPRYFPRRLPNALAVLALHQLEKVERFNEYRKEVVEMYREDLQGTEYELPESFEGRESMFLRVPVRHRAAHDIIKKAWRRNILIGDWYTNAVAPFDTQLDMVGYEKGSCSVAEQLGKETFNLPTHIHINTKEVARITNFLKSYGG